MRSWMIGLLLGLLPVLLLPRLPAPSVVAAIGAGGLLLLRLVVFLAGAAGRQHGDQGQSPNGAQAAPGHCLLKRGVHCRLPSCVRSDAAARCLGHFNDAGSIVRVRQSGKA